ncbi:MAG TPA: RDD family protein [Pyrinomonadaceae bacterium]
MTARIETTNLLASDAPERSSHAQSYMERFRAPFSLRCGALLVDYILLAGIIAFSTLMARVGSHQRASQSNAQMVGIFIAVSVAFINFIALPVLRGQTLGKWATGLRVRRKDGEPLSWWRALLRHLVVYPPFYIVLGLALLVADMLTPAMYAGACFAVMLTLGFLVATFSAHGRALHDIIADTVVVRESAKRRKVRVKV